MILTGEAIRNAVLSKDINISPYDDGNLNPETWDGATGMLNPASYDLALGSTVRVYKTWTHDCHEPGKIADGSRLYSRDEVLDVRNKLETRTYRIDPHLGWVLRPGIGYLMHTVERVHTDSFVPVIDGKSSIGRLFIQVHMTAGYVDPGFDGQYTLEVSVKHPVRVYPGMRFCQVRFHVPQGKVLLYNGHYLKDKAVGPVASEIHDVLRLPATGRSD